MLGGKGGITPESLDRVLKARGLLEPTTAKETKELNSALMGPQQHVQLPLAGTNQTFGKRDLEAHYLTQTGSFLNEASLDSATLD